MTVAAEELAAAAGGCRAELVIVVTLLAQDPIALTDSVSWPATTATEGNGSTAEVVTGTTVTDASERSTATAASGTVVVAVNKFISILKNENYFNKLPRAALLRVLRRTVPLLPTVEGGRPTCRPDLRAVGVVDGGGGVVDVGWKFDVVRADSFSVTLIRFFLELRLLHL